MITCRSYKNFSNDLFRDDLNSLLSKENMTLDFTSFANFTRIFIDTLNKHAPIKKKYVRTNHANFATKALRKAIMLRYRLGNIFLKEKSLDSKKAYNKQRNKKLRKNTIKKLAYQKLLTTRSFRKL